MNLVLGIILVAVTVVSGLFVFALFIWGAIKDGEANDAANPKGFRRRWPR